MDDVPALTEGTEHKENEQPVKSAIVLAERTHALLQDERIIKPVADQTEPAPVLEVCFVLLVIHPRSLPSLAVALFPACTSFAVCHQAWIWLWDHPLNCAS